MAFPLPAHLPRKKHPQDVSSAILSTVSEANAESLNASLATSWVLELDESILASRKSIHERMQQDFSVFERQLASTKSVQTRLHSLENNVDSLSNALSDPQTGLAPKLIKQLSEHASLAQTALNAEVSHRTLSHLLQCRTTFNTFAQLVSDGDLPEAVKLSGELEKLLEDVPPPLGDAGVTKGLKRQYRAMRDRADEQLNDACSRAVSIDPFSLAIRPAVQVRQSSNILSLPSIMASLSFTSLTEHLTTLRRDITTHYIDYVLSQPLSVITSSATGASGVPEEKVELVPAAPESDAPASRIDNLSVVLSFLHAHLFPAVPEPQRSAFLRLLAKPLTAGILNHLLIPFLPSSLSLLPAYLKLVSRAVRFEEEDLSKLFGGISVEKEIKTWTDGIVSHYEKKRRIDILDDCRQMLMRGDESGSMTFCPEKFEPSTTLPSRQKTLLSYETIFDKNLLQNSNYKVQAPVADTAAMVNDVDEDSWGFDDDVEATPETSSDDIEEDPWGWNADASTENGNVEDAGEPSWDAWDEPLAAPNGNSPKPAKRLEKFSSKGKNVQRSDDNIATSLASEAPPSAVPMPIRSLGVQSTVVDHIFRLSGRHLVSVRMKEIVSIVEGVLKEAEEFSCSKLFSSFPSSMTSPGTLIFQTAPSILDLFRALYPVIFSSDLSTSPTKPMQLSNNCLYLGEEVGRISSAFVLNKAVKDKFNDCQDKLNAFGQRWFENAIEQQISEIDDILVPTQGFTDTGDQESFDVCEGAVNEILQKIKHVGQQWKGLLAQKRYHTAVGSIVEAALVRIMEDITALPDIPAVESHRLSELCRILNALEGLFGSVNPITAPVSSSVASYVPSWLKFSYLSELLEASMADISYLFEEGSLVDFEVDELVKLVRALFADTPLRTNTINKIQQGHPNRGSI